MYCFWWWCGSNCWSFLIAAYCFLSLDVGERLLLSSQTGVTSGKSLLILEQAIINFIFILVSSRASGVRWIPLYWGARKFAVLLHLQRDLLLAYLKFKFMFKIKNSKFRSKNFKKLWVSIILSNLIKIFKKKLLNWLSHAEG